MKRAAEAAKPDVGDAASYGRRYPSEAAALLHVPAILAADLEQRVADLPSEQ
jgi:hypothetical protein